MEKNYNCPVWLKFLNEIFMNDENLIDYVQMLVGMLLSDYNVEQKLYALYGTGANGKSVFAEILIKLADDKIAMISKDILTKKNYQLRYEDYLMLKNASIVLIAEPSKDDKFYMSTIKKITGGDTITVFDKKENKIIKFKAKAKLLFMTNYMPEFKDEGYAVDRRFEIIPFNRTFLPYEIDKFLLPKLLKELEDIKLWANEGLEKWKNSPVLNVPQIIENAKIEEWKNKIDPKFHPIVNCLRRDYQAGLTIYDIYHLGVHLDMLVDSFWNVKQNPIMVGKLLTQLSTDAPIMIKRDKIYQGINLVYNDVTKDYIDNFGDFSYKSQIDRVKKIKLGTNSEDRLISEFFKKKQEEYEIALQKHKDDIMEQDCV